MSAETIQWLSENTLIGFTAKRGNAWHHREGDNNHFEGAVPRERAIKLLDYPLELARIVGEIDRIDEDGVQTVRYPGEGRVAVIRLDTGDMLGVFKDGYKIHTPLQWLLENMDLILDGGLQIGSVVRLKKGAVVALQAELSETREGPEGILHRPHLTAATSCDGSLATTYLTGTQVVVCDNTLSAALTERKRLQVKVRHTSRSLANIGEVRRSLALEVEQVGDEFDQQVRKLLDDTVSDARWNEFVKAYTGVEVAKEGRSKTMAQNKVKALNDLWNNDLRVAPWKGSAYGVVAAVNTAQHHIFGSDKDREERNQARLVQGQWDAIDRSTVQLLATV